MSGEHEDWGCKICGKETVGYFLGKNILCYDCYEEYLRMTLGTDASKIWENQNIPTSNFNIIHDKPKKEKKKRVPKHPFT